MQTKLFCLIDEHIFMFFFTHKKFWKHFRLNGNEESRLIFIPMGESHFSQSLMIIKFSDFHFLHFDKFIEIDWEQVLSTINAIRTKQESTLKLLLKLVENFFFA